MMHFDLGILKATSKYVDLFSANMELNSNLASSFEISLCMCPPGAFSKITFLGNIRNSYGNPDFFHARSTPLRPVLKFR